jgi:hypothetical protein
MKRTSSRTKVTTLAILSACLVTMITAAPADLVAGNGEWQSNSGVAMRGTWTVALERAGSELSGTISMTGSLLFSGAKVTGTLDGDQIMLGAVTDGEYRMTFSGRVTEEKITGEWQCDALGDSGTWSGTLRLASAGD